MENKKVVLIEDDADIYSLLAGRLQKEGYLVKRANNAKEGMALIESENPNLVLTEDAILGEDNFLSVVAKMQQKENLKKIPIMTIFNSFQPSQIEKAKNFGVFVWAVKTEFNLDEIVKKVKTLLSG